MKSQDLLIFLRITFECSKSNRNQRWYCWWISNEWFVNTKRQRSINVAVFDSDWPMLAVVILLAQHSVPFSLRVYPYQLIISFVNQGSKRGDGENTADLNTQATNNNNHIFFFLFTWPRFFEIGSPQNHTVVNWWSADVSSTTVSLSLSSIAPLSVCV